MKATFLIIAVLATVFLPIRSGEVFKIDTLVEGDGQEFPP